MREFSEIEAIENGAPGSSLGEGIRIRVGSEIGTLRTVAMCWANPFRLTPRMVMSMFSPSVWAELRHNAWDTYDYRRVREQQERVVEILRAHGASVLLLDSVPGVCSQH